MTTSVEAIEAALIKVRRHQNPKAAFRDALAETMGMEGEGAGYEAVLHLVRLFAQLERQIKSASVEEKVKNRCMTYLQKFNGIRSLSQVGSALEAAQKNFLTPEHLSCLSEIRVEMHGQLPADEQIGDADVFLETFEKALQELLRQELPVDVKALLVARVQEVIDCIRAYRFLGKASLQAAMEKLVGATATALHDPNVNAQPNRKEAVIALGKTAMNGVAYLHLAFTGTYEAVEAAQGLYQLFQGPA